MVGFCEVSGGLSSGAAVVSVSRVVKTSMFMPRVQVASMFMPRVKTACCGESVQVASMFMLRAKADGEDLDAHAESPGCLDVYAESEDCLLRRVKRAR